MSDGNDENTTPQAIMEAAVRLFSERGYNGVSVREITEAAGITKPTLYYHFGSKEGLCRAIVESVIREKNAIEERCLALVDSSLKQIGALARAKFRSARDNSHVVKFLTEFLLGPDSSNLLREIDVECSWKNGPFVRGIVAAQKDNLIRRDLSPLLIAGVLEGALDRHVLAYVHFGEPELTDELADSIVNLIVYGAAVKVE